MTLTFSNGTESFDFDTPQRSDKQLFDVSAQKTPNDGENYNFFSFFINDAEFLLPIATVQEVIILPSISFLPDANPFLDGAFTLRGSILPAINMRKILGSPRGEPSPESRIIIAREAGADFGMIVDGINQVITLPPDQLEDQDHCSLLNCWEFCSFAFKNEGKTIGIIDPRKLLAHISREPNLDLS